MVAMALIRSSHPCLDLMLELLHNETLQKKLSLNEDRQSAKRRASVGTLELGTHGKKEKKNVLEAVWLFKSRLLLLQV